MNLASIVRLNIIKANIGVQHWSYFNGQKLANAAGPKSIESEDYYTHAHYYLGGPDLL